MSAVKLVEKRRLSSTFGAILAFLSLLMLTLPAVHAQTVVATITVGSHPVGVAVDPVTSEVWVANCGANSLCTTGEGVDQVTVIDEKTGTVVATVPLAGGNGGVPLGVAVNVKTDPTIYVANEGTVTSAGTLYTITEKDHHPTAEVPIESKTILDPQDIGVNPVTDRVYVSSRGLNTVFVLNGDTNAIIARISVTQAGGVAVNTATNLIYVYEEVEHTVAVIDGSTNTVISSVPMSGNNPCGLSLAANPLTNKIYAVAQQFALPFQPFTVFPPEVNVIDGSTNTVTAVIPVGANPCGVDVDPATNMIYVANTGDNTVSVINGSTNSVTTTVAVGQSPVGVAVDVRRNLVWVSDSGASTVTAIAGA